MTDVPPKVWIWNVPSGGQFASINRPVAGATHDKKLPVGKHPFQLYSLGTPNGQKITIMFEELLDRGHRDAEYDAWLINIGDGDQFGSGFVELNPNSKIPALLDRSGPEPIRVFESGAILHLAEKFGEFLPESGPARAETLSWLFWQMGSAPFLGGGFGHLFAYAPTKEEYPINRYAIETKRQFDVLDRRLADNEFINGRGYSVADIAIWPWYGQLALRPQLQGCRRVPVSRRLRQRAALGPADRRPAGGAARPHRQQDERRPERAAPRAPRRQRLRASHSGQAGGGIGVRRPAHDEVRYEMLRPRMRIDVEAVPSVEADRPLVVLKYVEPHRPVPA